MIRGPVYKFHPIEFWVDFIFGLVTQVTSKNQTVRSFDLTTVVFFFVTKQLFFSNNFFDVVKIDKNRSISLYKQGVVHPNDNFGIA